MNYVKTINILKTIKTDFHDKKMFLVVYDSSHITSSDKVRFYYALKGRDGNSGILKRYSGEFLSKKVLLFPEKHIDDIKMFLKH